MTAKRAGTLLIALVSSLLLTGCDVPTNLEGLFDWRDKFFLHIETSTVEQLLGPLLGLLTAMATVIALWGVITNMRNRKSPWGGTYLTGLVLLVTAGLILKYIPIATSFGISILPQDLTLDKVFGALRWELSSNPIELATVAWGISFTLVLPLISAFWEIVMLVAAVIAIAMSITGQTIKGVIFAVVQILGWGLFLVMYNTLVSLIGTYYPTWNLSSVAVLTSVFYMGATLFLLLACYVGLPWLAASLAPSRSAEEVKEREEKRRFNIDLNDILNSPIPIPIPYERHEESEVDDGEDGDEMPPYYTWGPYNPESPQNPGSPESPIPVIYLPGGISEEYVERGSAPDVIELGGGGSEGKEYDYVPLVENDTKTYTKPIQSEQPPTQPVRNPSKVNEEDLLPDSTKNPSSTSEKRRAETISKAAEILTVAGTVTGQPKLVLGGKAVKFAVRIAEELSAPDADPKDVLSRQVKAIAEKAAESLFPGISDEDLLPDTGKKGGEF